MKEQNSKPATTEHSIRAEFGRLSEDFYGFRVYDSNGDLLTEFRVDPPATQEKAPQ